MRIERPIDMLVFATAGNAYFTVVSKKTKTRYTYRVAISDDQKLLFVSYLRGADNNGDYTYLGTIRNAAGALYQHGKKSRVDADSDVARGFAWVWRAVVEKLEDRLGAFEFYHEGRCGRCARRLTVPESITRGIGPECATKLGTFAAEEVA